MYAFDKADRGSPGRETYVRQLELAGVRTRLRALRS